MKAVIADDVINVVVEIEFIILLYSELDHLLVLSRHIFIVECESDSELADCCILSLFSSLDNFGSRLELDVRISCYVAHLVSSESDCAKTFLGQDKIDVFLIVRLR